jgi:hypothetical protein
MMISNTEFLAKAIPASARKLRGHINAVKTCLANNSVLYKHALGRPPLSYAKAPVGRVLNLIREGILVVDQRSGISFIDEDDRMFCEVAKRCSALDLLRISHLILSL